MSEKPPEYSDSGPVYLLKLVSGEEIIAQTVEVGGNRKEGENPVAIGVIKPMKVMIDIAPIATTGYIKPMQQIFLNRWLPFTNDPIIFIPFSKILTFAAVAGKVEEYYNDAAASFYSTNIHGTKEGVKEFLKWWQPGDTANNQPN